jgi:hypothetical protein
MLTNLRRLFGYNTRIMMGNSYWLLIVPVVASQLIIFWHMAIATLVTAKTIADSFELVLPLLAAFLCAHVVAPEHQNRVDELTFVRPVPFVRTIALRVLSMYGVVALLGYMMLIVYKNGLKTEFVAGTTVLAGIPSVLFLSALAIAFSSAWRSPAVGIGIALAYWAADAAWGASLNPLFTLHGYAVALAGVASGKALGSAWLISKGILLALTLIAGWFARGSLGTPAAPRRWRSVVRLVAGTVPLVVLYLIAGAYWQLAEARRAAAQEPRQARIIYRRAFAGFGCLPVPYLFGPGFATYIGYPRQGDATDLTQGRNRDAALLRMLHAAQADPDGAWADHALYEYIRLGGVAAPESDAAHEDKRVALGYCRTFLEQYPASMFAPEVAARMVRLGLACTDLKASLWAYERALKAYQGTAGASEAATAMQDYYNGQGDVPHATEAAMAAASAAPAATRPEALLRLGGFFAEHGQPAEARQAFSQVADAVQAALEAKGLATVDAAHTSATDLAARTSITRLRTQARDAIAALDAAAAGAAPPPPPPPPPGPAPR